MKKDEDKEKIKKTLFIQTEKICITGVDIDDRNLYYRLMDEEQMILSQLRLIKSFIRDWIEYRFKETFHPYEVFVKQMQDCCEINKEEVNLLN